MLIATIPAPQHLADMTAVLEDPDINAIRFNTGVSNPYTAQETLEMLQFRAVSRNKKLLVDYKYNQVRIAKWGIPTYGDIELNHAIRVDLPARIIFRDGHETDIVAIKDGNKIYVSPNPKEAVGMGEAVNIHGNNLKIFGGFTDTDNEYIEAAIKLGIHDHMISFVEEENDIYLMLERDPQATIYAKIESPKGLDFVREVYPKLREKKIKIILVAALDDLYVNIGEDKTAIFDALDLIIKNDPEAIAASRIFTSLQKGDTISMADLTNQRFLESIGYRSFMLSDGVCFRKEIFQKAMLVMRQYRERFSGNR